MLNWIKDFLFGRKIQVRIGSDPSAQYTVGNGSPQGSVIGLILFITVINGVFSKVPADIGRSLFADDGALWKRSSNTEHAIRKAQGAVDEVLSQGFSVKKTKTLFFTRKRIEEGRKLRMYGSDLERVGKLKLGQMASRGQRTSAKTQ